MGKLSELLDTDVRKLENLKTIPHSAQRALRSVYEMRAHGAHWSDGRWQYRW